MQTYLDRRKVSFPRRPSAKSQVLGDLSASLMMMIFDNCSYFINSFKIRIYIIVFIKSQPSLSYLVFSSTSIPNLKSPRLSGCRAASMISSLDVRPSRSIPQTQHWSCTSGSSFCIHRSSASALLKFLSLNSKLS